MKADESHPRSATPAGEVAAVPYEQRAEALRILLTGSRSGPETVVQPFLSFVRQQGVALDRLFGAYVEGRLASVCLVLPSPGRTGMVFISPAADRRRERLVADAARHAVSRLDAERFRLVQALLDPTQIGERRALERAGFEALATLMYMNRPAEKTPPAWSREDRIEALGLEPRHWSEAHRGLFARAIERSYRDTLDCPGLVGMRHIDDVIAGHMATGRFDPELWTVYHRDGEPAAVTLLACVQDEETYELVYLGVDPAWRGRGLGEQVMRRGLTQVAARGAKRVCLAVDQDNRPARRLYTAMGFRSMSRKVAMIHALNERG